MLGTADKLPWLTLRRVAIVAAFASLLTAGILALLYREMGGPGDQLDYFDQAARFIPYVHNYYGPGYLIALRVVHVATSLDWYCAVPFSAAFWEKKAAGWH
jgi:hypothetical protein